MTDTIALNIDAGSPVALPFNQYKHGVTLLTTSPVPTDHDTIKRIDIKKNANKQRKLQLNVIYDIT